MSTAESPAQPLTGGARSYRFLTMAEALAHLGHWHYDVLTGELTLSDEANRIHGFPIGSQPTVDSAIAAYVPEHRAAVEAVFHDALATGVLRPLEARIARIDGVRDIATGGMVERAADGTVVALMGIIQDVTDRKSAERERDRLIERMTRAARAGEIGFWEFDLLTKALLWDDNMFALFGVEPGAARLGERFWQLVHPDDRERVRSRFDAARQPDETIDTDFRIVRGDEIRTIRTLGTVVAGADGVPVRMVGANWDITELRTLAESLRSEKDALAKSEARYRALSEVIPQIVYVVGTDGVLEFVNTRWTEYTGLSLEQARGVKREKLIRAADFATIDRLRARMPPAEFECEVRLRRHDGVERCHLYRCVPFADVDGSHRWIVSATDIEDRINAELRIASTSAELTHLAQHDVLTDLPNRKLLLERLTEATARAARSGTRVIVLYLDLDRFKLVNDRFGHTAGDRVLAETGRRIARTLRAGDTASRVGNDEFVLVCASSDESENAGMLAARLIATVGQPIDVGDAYVTVGAGIGVCQYPADDTDPDALIRKADAAMHVAKQSGRNSYRAFTPDMNETLAQTLQLEADLRAAISERQFEVHYQPIIGLRTGSIIGAEALVRWRHPQRGLLQPDAFIPFAEETGCIAQIGDIVLHEACAFIKRLRLDAPSQFSIAVNVSAAQFVSSGFVEQLGTAAARHEIDVRRLEIEITESIVMGNTAATTGVLRDLKALGVNLSLDDFGTGYSSLAYIKNFPIDTLKIDRSFVRDIATDRTDQALAKTIITLAHNLGMRVIGEGAETHAQLDRLRSFGADCAQGYLISRPLPETAFEAFRRAYRPLP